MDKQIDVRGTVASLASIVRLHEGNKSESINELLERVEPTIAAVEELMTRAGALGPLISEAVAASPAGLMREDALRRRDAFYAALLTLRGEA